MLRTPAAVGNDDFAGTNPMSALSLRVGAKPRTTRYHKKPHLTTKKPRQNQPVTTVATSDGTQPARASSSTRESLCANHSSRILRSADARPIPRHLRPDRRPVDQRLRRRQAIRIGSTAERHRRREAGASATSSGRRTRRCAQQAAPGGGQADSASRICRPWNG